MTEDPKNLEEVIAQRKVAGIRGRYHMGEITREQMHAEIFSLTEAEMDAAGATIRPRPVAIEQAEAIDQMWDDVTHEVYEQRTLQLAWEHKDDPRAIEIIKQHRPETT